MNTAVYVGSDFSVSEHVLVLPISKKNPFRL